MVTHFKSNRPYNYFLLLVYGTILLWSIFLNPVSIDHQTTGYFYSGLHVFLINLSQRFEYFSSFCVLLLLFVQAILINMIAIKQKLFTKTNYLPGMCFLLFASIFISRIKMSDALIVNTILIWILSKLCVLQNAVKAKTLLFNIGFIFGIATLTFQPAIFFIILLFFALLLTRPFRLTEWIILVIGTITPYYFLESWLFLTGKKIASWIPKIHIDFPVVMMSKWQLLTAVFVLLVLFYSMYLIHFNMRKLLVQSRNSWTILIFYFFTSIFVSFFASSANFTDWVFLLTPVAVISAATFLYIDQKWIIVTLHWLLVIMSFFIGYYDLLR